MTGLIVEGLWQRRGATPVLRGVDLTIPHGAIVALLGPSGCGKTSLLRLIAGFEPADEGRITLDDQVLEAPGRHVPAERRRIGYVPQDGTLFPHLTVEANVGFGLGRAERRRGDVAAALALTGLTGLERRWPHQLSGGQQQRTALARALAPRPGLVLLDEPFAALDRALRRSVCADVVALLRASGATAVLVTHDPQEAFASADTVAAMRAGVIVQHADGETLYRRPADLDIARLTGATIVLPGVMRGDHVDTALGLLPVAVGAAGAVQAMLRPEQVRAADDGVELRVLARVFRGDHTLLTVEAAGQPIEIPLAAPPPPGETARLRVDGPVVAYSIGRPPVTGISAEVM